MEASVSLQQFFAMLFNKSLDLTEIRLSEPVIRRERYRVEPKLCLQIITSDVDMRGFGTFATVEMKAIATYSENCRHEREWSSFWNSRADEEMTSQGNNPRRFFASHTRLMPSVSAAMRMETFSCFA